MSHPVNFPHIIDLGEPNGGITPICPECARLTAELSEARNLLGTLLAILNGDGGQHQKEAGDVQAVADASQRYWSALAAEYPLTVYREFFDRRIDLAEASDNQWPAALKRYRDAKAAVLSLRSEEAKP